jgi:hypothetical protein
MRPNETQAQPPLAGTSSATEFNVEVIEKLVIGTASGWLQRLVELGTNFALNQAPPYLA